MAVASSFFSLSSSSTRVLPSLPIKFKRRSLVIVNFDPKTGTEAESVTSNSSKSISTYKLISGIGGLGFVETAYLTYTKLTNSDAFCPASSGGSGGCGDILSSDYALVFGVPLPLIGLVAYGLVATVGLQLAGKGLPFGVDENSGRLILLGSATAMASASACLLYILSTEFAGVTCQYCLLSALLSFSLFFTIVKDFGLEEIQKWVGIQLSIAGLVIAALSTSYSSSQPFSSSMAEMELKPFTTEIITESNPLALSLAKHLHSIGAKMYGAFWCSHCVEQKQMFGREAAKLLDYVECFPDGYRKGIKMAKACGDVGIEGFPTWVINGQVYSGELDFDELAQASGFNSEVLRQPN